MVAGSRAPSRIAVHLSPWASARTCRELGAFARYCIRRLEHELGEWEAWAIDIAPSARGYTSHIAVRDRGALLEEHGTGLDGPLAIWEAMCRLEQRLREHRRV
jgi:hypothetical protein